MLPGPNRIRQCSGCRKPFSQPTFTSGNNFGATCWTDGKRVAPMLPDTPRLVKCPHCEQLLWIAETVELGEEKFDSISTWPDALRYARLTEQDYLSAIETPLADSVEKVRYLRVRAWWAANDSLRRDLGENSVAISEDARRNLECLLNELLESDEHQRLMKAEVARELGSFEEAERLLATEYGDNLQHASRRITELVRARKTGVATL